MPYPRHVLVSPETTPYYHCTSRCVRRAFLCGVDELTGRDYEHRKQWMVDRLMLLVQVFAIDICAYAVMSNHHHVVLRIDKAQAEALSDEAVAERWSRLFELPARVDRYLEGAAPDSAEAESARAWIEAIRERLWDVSWFMRCLNESIARQANAEDRCTGRFWEGRFKSQALLDEAALLICMSYVDLNPIRAGIAKTPEASEYTSVMARIEAYRRSHSDTDPTPKHLLAFRGAEHRDAPDHLPFSLVDYLELVDWSGRAVREDKRGAIPDTIPPILERLSVDPVAYLKFLRAKRNVFTRAVGEADKLRQTAKAIGQRYLRGIGASQALFPRPG